MKNVEVIKANTTLVNRNFSKKIDRLRVAAYCRVSTDSEDQLNSYKSQVKHYTDYINQNHDWVFAGIYADEAITGTQTTKREDFQRMINDAMNGEIDMVVTKSISRFARNTLDTLKYVRLLKGKNVAVFFEEENINTLTMDGELLLVILSSVAQQEVENISANVKKGLKMKMQRGELVGFQGCLGYDYNPETKSISVNEKEAEIVRYIFDRYLGGMGCGIIARELGELGYKTPRGYDKWCDTTVMGIIKNEKYKGDIRQGKTFTVDPISKRRLDNFGEEDQFYMSEHHEPIISAEDFEAAQQIRMKRAANRFQPNGTREKYSRKYAFSSMLECGFCGSGYSRRSWHAGSNYHKIIWQCITAIRMGKKDCMHSKAIQETTLENAFLESYKLLCYNNSDVLTEMLERIESTLCSTDNSKEIARLDKQIYALEKKKEKLLDMHLEDVIDKETYEKKLADVTSKLEKFNNEKFEFLNSAERTKKIKTRLNNFRKVISEHEVLEVFDRCVFESIVDKVIVGGYDEEGNPDPKMLTFIYKTGFTNEINSENHKPERKNGRAKEFMNLPSFANETREKLAKLLPSFQLSDTHRGRVLPGERKMKTTDKGYINKNNQRNNGIKGKSDTHYNQSFFEMECLDCGHKYLANGCDVWLRRCTICQSTKATNKSKAKKTTRTISDKLRYQVLKRDNFKCCACGASPAKDSSIELHIDHIIPWSKGGETTIDNLQTLCSRCNLGKSDLV